MSRRTMNWTNCLKLNFSLRESSIMAITHEERSHSAARPHNKCGRALAVTQSPGCKRGMLDHLTTQMPLRRGLPGRGCCWHPGLGSQFMKHNVEVYGAPQRCDQWSTAARGASAPPPCYTACFLKRSMSLRCLSRSFSAEATACCFMRMSDAGEASRTGF